MATDVIKFVDSIAASPTVRLDINDGATWRTTRFDAPPPRLRRASSQNAMRDGIFVSSSQYDARVLTLELTLVHTSEDAKATEIQKLARELDRDTNFLMYQPTGATKPVFFRLYRSDMSQLEQFTGLPSSLGKPTIELLAEPFAYGLLETIGPVTVAYDPAGTNGCYFDATGVIGDVEALPAISWPQAASGSQYVYGVRRRGTPSAMPFLLQAESMTASTDTSVQANSANYSGAGSNWMKCTFATSSALITRLSLTDYPSTDIVDARGRYRVYARVSFDGASAVNTTTLQLWSPTGSGLTGSAFALGPTATVPGPVAGVNYAIVYLGLVQIPLAADPVVKQDGTTLAVDGVGLQLRASLTGTGNLGVDYLLFMPADDRMGIVTEGTGVASSDTVVDANANIVWTRTSGGAVASVDTQSAMVGGFPALTPNVTNRICFRPIPTVSTTAYISTTVDVTVTYHPRYLLVRPSTT